MNNALIAVALLVASLPASLEAQPPRCAEGEERQVVKLIPCIGKGYCLSEGATHQIRCAPPTEGELKRVWELTEDGGVVGEGFYLGRQPEGMWRYYWAPGQLKMEVPYHRGLPIGVVRTYHPNGQLAAVEPYNEKSLAHGEEKHWWPNGQLRSRVEYAHGRPASPTWKWYETGEVECIAPGPGQDGRAEGVWRCWHPDGTLRKEATWKHGCLNGPFRLWGADGILVEEGDYVDDRKCGPWLIQGKRVHFDCESSSDDAEASAPE